MNGGIEGPQNHSADRDTGSHLGAVRWSTGTVHYGNDERISDERQTETIYYGERNDG